MILAARFAGFVFAGVEEKIANVGAGEINAGAELFEGAVALDVILADALLADLDLVQERNGAEAENAQ